MNHLTPSRPARAAARRPHRAARTALAAGVASLALLLSSCSLIDDLRGGGDEPTAAPSSTATEAFFDSQFTRDGTFQSHIEVDQAPGIDFVYTLYPTKSTPRTNEWYPRGSKYFSFTFQAYDLDRELRDPFRTKRDVYLREIRVTSSTERSDGGASESPYELDAMAQRITLDPEPVTRGRYGMLITSPKGAFELRNQEISETDLATIGLNLVFTASVYVETRAGSNRFERATVEQRVPIAIFASDKETEVADIPVNAN